VKKSLKCRKNLLMGLLFFGARNAEQIEHIEVNNSLSFLTPHSLTPQLTPQTLFNE
jgi:hypothetical protein